VTSRPLREPLMTPRVAAAKLGMSVKTLMSHISRGQLRFINIGTKTRKVHRFTSYNLETVIENQKVMRYAHVTDGEVADALQDLSSSRQKSHEKPHATESTTKGSAG
jgi:predicted site-specific integrase-resolvase